MHRTEYDRLYRIWKAMRVRCNNPNTSEYHRYGGRGIKVCEEWNNYFVFQSWAYSHGYADNLTIDRIDNDKGYSPNNCRWITLKEQQMNRSSCFMITHDGRTQNLTQWCKEYDIDRHVLKKRLMAGIPFEEAVIRRRKKKVIA